MASSERPELSEIAREDAGRDPHTLRALKALQAELDRRPLPEAYSKEAVARLLDMQTEYVEELGLEAIRIARRERNHEVQPVNVDRADEVVRSGPALLRGGIQTFGGLLWGAAISQFGQEIVATDPRWWLIAISVGVLVAATGLLVYGYRR